MLNIPTCINDKDIPLIRSLSAPYETISELHLMIQLLNQNRSFNKFDIKEITPRNLSENTCEKIQNDFPKVIKYCGLCKFSRTNVLFRVDPEIELLNFIYHNGPTDSITIDIFKYYLIDSYDERVFIGADIYKILMSNYGNADLLDAILITLYQDDAVIKAQVQSIIKKVISTNLNFNLQECIEKLSCKEKEKPKPINSMSILDLLNKKSENSSNQKNNEIIAKPKSKQKLKIINSEILDNEVIQTPKQITFESFINSESEGQKSLPESVVQIVLNYKLQANIKEQSINYDQLQIECISNSEAFINTENDITLIIERNGIQIKYPIDPHDIAGRDFIKLLFSNRNIIKIVDSLETLASKVSLSILYSVFDIGIVSSTEDDFINKYQKTVMSYSVDQMKMYKKQIQIRQIKLFNLCEESNVIFKINGPEELFDEILYTAQLKKVFDKFNIKYFKNSKHSLELYIDDQGKTLAVDYFLTIIRSELKKRKQKSEFEVIMK